jgi:hypothetical protein
VTADFIQSGVRSGVDELGALAQPAAAARTMIVPANRVILFIALTLTETHADPAWNATKKRAPRMLSRACSGLVNIRSGSRYARSPIAAGRAYGQAGNLALDAALVIVRSNGPAGFSRLVTKACRRAELRSLAGSRLSIADCLYRRALARVRRQREVGSRDVGVMPSHTVRLASAALRCYLARDRLSVVNGVASPDRTFRGLLAVRRQASGKQREIIPWKNQRT